MTASGGIGPYTYLVSGGSLPAGLTLNPPTGVISGTPTGSGTSTFTIQATDTLGNIGTHVYTVNIGTLSLTVNPASLPNGSLGLAYSQTVSATGGTGPYTFSILAGTLPAGLTLNTSSGVIAGTPTSAGSSTFTVQAVNSLGNSGTRDYTINIGTVSLTVNPATLPATVVGHVYSQTVYATGGIGPYTYTISAGALPPGLTLDPATGVISGTPTSASPATFTVLAVDSFGNTGSRAYTLSGRPDPALDPEVRGLIAAQVASAQRFASTQVTNITHHLENLHEHFNGCSFNFNIAPPLNAPPPQQFGAPSVDPNYADPNAVYSPYGNYARPSQGYTAEASPRRAAGPFVNGAADPMTTGADLRLQPQPPYWQPQRRVPRCTSDWASDMALWTAGSFQFGSMSPNGAASDNHFNTAGLTLGVDVRASDSLIVGLASGSVPTAAKSVPTVRAAIRRALAPRSMPACGCSIRCLSTPRSVTARSISTTAAMSPARAPWRSARARAPIGSARSRRAPSSDATRSSSSLTPWSISVRHRSTVIRKTGRAPSC